MYARTFGIFMKCSFLSVENPTKVYHEVGTKASYEIVNQGIVHIVMLEYRVAERD